MKRYRIIGKSRNMEPLYLTDENGKFHEHRIIKGKEVVVTEDQLNFHTKRREARGIIEIVEIPEEVKATPISTIVLDEPVEEKPKVLQETPAVKIDEIDEEAPKKKPRRRRKKVQKKTDE